MTFHLKSSKCIDCLWSNLNAQAAETWNVWINYWWSLHHINSKFIIGEKKFTLSLDRYPVNYHKPFLHIYFPGRLTSLYLRLDKHKHLDAEYPKWWWQLRVGTHPHFHGWFWCGCSWQKNSCSEELFSQWVVTPSRRKCLWLTNQTAKNSLLYFIIYCWNTSMASK